jgi:hypothetical protein
MLAAEDLALWQTEQGSLFYKVLWQPVSFLLGHTLSFFLTSTGITYKTHDSIIDVLFQLFFKTIIKGFVFSILTL